MRFKDQLEVYREPSGGQFLQLQIFKPERSVATLFASEVKLEWRKALFKILKED